MREYFLVESGDRHTIAPDAKIHQGPKTQPFLSADAAYHYGRGLVTDRAVRCNYLLVCFQDGKPGEELLASRTRKALVIAVV